jgi:integrase
VGKKITSKIFKRKSGKSVGKWIVRISYFDEASGRNKDIERQADLRSGVIDIRDKLLGDLKKTHGKSPIGERMTFGQLAETCKKTFYVPAVIMDGRQVAGVRSVQSAHIHIDALKEFFGGRLINDISPESLRDYKVWRMKRGSRRPTKNGERPGIKLSTVNRELAVMRKMMRYAFGEGWMLRDIFFNAKVIDTSSEAERSRILTRSEEMSLLAACEGDRNVRYLRTVDGKPTEVEARIRAANFHLKGMIVLALDSSMRRGEILKLRWSDIDFERNLVTVVSTHTKILRERIAPLSDRAKAELELIREFTSGERPFPFSSIKRSFATACRIAGIQDLQFRDLRRTAITRWLQQGTPLAFAGKLAGHSQLQTTMKHYTATDAEMIGEINERMNRAQELEDRQEADFVN